MNRPNWTWVRALLVCVGLLLCLWPGALQSESSSIVVSSQATSQPQRFKIPKSPPPGQTVLRPDPPEVALGERLFLEPRFAQFFFAHSRGDANTNLPTGDAALDSTITVGQPLPGPFAGLSMNCRACHLVNEHAALGRGHRTYADYARRSPIPAREDGKTVTVRNAPAMVNALIPRDGPIFLHPDGEFLSGEALVRGTLTGRNYGWLPHEQAQAIRHVAHIIRNDDGRGQLAEEFGGYSYRRILRSTDPDLNEAVVLPEEFCLDLAEASDAQVLDAVARLIDAYMTSLFFSRDDLWDYDGSPYDAFLAKNHLPRKADPGQSERYYARHLLSLIDGLVEPRFISPADNCFKLLKQDFRFGPLELAGLKIFFTLAGTDAKGAASSAGKIGNCVACHLPPNFTDFAFHNTGATQEEYDALHGAGKFAALFIPDLAQRQANPDAYLPPTAGRPRALGPFLDIPAPAQPGRTDLGLWNVFANPDHPLVQPALRQLLAEGRRGVSEAELLPKTIALFKTPGLRGLAHSGPYLHHGRKDSLEDVIEFYVKTSTQARAGQLRNAAPELPGIRLRAEDVAPLAAFLRSLNEDYE